MSLGERKAELQGTIATLEEQKRVLISEVANLNEKIAVAELESVARVLEGEVARLREEKTMLEEKLPSQDAQTEGIQVAHVA